MQEMEEKTVRETELLSTLAELENLAEKKTGIYSRLLTDPTLAKEMELLSARHTSRKELLEKLAFGKVKSKKKDNEKGGAGAE